MENYADVRFAKPGEPCDGAVGEAGAIFESHQLSLSVCKPGKEDEKTSIIGILLDQVLHILTDGQGWLLEALQSLSRYIIRNYR